MSSEREENHGPEIFAFGDWQEHLNRAHARYWVRIHTTLRALKAEAANRGLLHAPIVEKQKAAFSELRGFISDALAWIQREQNRGTCNASPFTASRESEVIASVHGILANLPELLADTDDDRREVMASCESRKGYFVNDLIRPRFYDGRADFQPAEVKKPPSDPPGLKANHNEESGGGPDLKNPPNRYDGRTTPAKKRKRSTQRGDAGLKLIAALTEHHKFAQGGCLNLEYIGNNELARKAEVSKSSAKLFFDKEFGGSEREDGHAKYKVVCRDAGRLVESLKVLNSEFSPHELYGRRPPGEQERDENE